MDVTCSTSSIFNLVAISIDRYIAVTQPIKYAKHKNNRRVWLTIVLVWVISVAIGSPIVLGLNNTPDRVADACLFYNSDFIIYSSLSSFYIPCIIMMFLYYNIFKVLSKRAMTARMNRKPFPSEIKPGSVIQNMANTHRLAETALGPTGAEEAATNTGSGSGDEDDDGGPDDCQVISNDKSTEFILATVVEEAAAVKQLQNLQHQRTAVRQQNQLDHQEEGCNNIVLEDEIGMAEAELLQRRISSVVASMATPRALVPMASSHPPPVLHRADPNGNNDSGFADAAHSDVQLMPHDSPRRTLLAAATAAAAANSRNKNGTTAGTGTGGIGARKGGVLVTRAGAEKKSVSTVLNSAGPGRDRAAALTGGSSSSSKKERKATTAAARFTIYKVNKASRKKREKSSAKKERKATKTLAIVLGVFLICWVPFFTCNILDAMCSKLGKDCQPGFAAFLLTTWLGYMNSFVNPVIYTIFNPEFRKAFKKLMHMKP